MKKLISHITRHPFAALTVYSALIVIACLWPFSFSQKNLATFESGKGLHFVAPSIAYANADLSALKAADGFTLLLKWSPDRAWHSRHRARIFAFGRDDTHQNFSLEDDGQHMVLVLTSGRGVPLAEAYLPHPANPRVQSWAAFTFDGRKIEAFSDGRKVSSAVAGQVKISSWDMTYPLVYGATGDGKRPWNGTLDSCAILGRRCSREEMKRPAALLAESSPLVFVHFREGEDFTSGAKSMHPVALTVPGRFVPLEYAILHYVTPGAGGVMDIILNIAAFVPFGFMLVTGLAQRGYSPSQLVVLALLSAGVLSTSLEVLQAFIPGRTSSITDVISNVAGAVPGVLISRRINRYGEKGT